MRLGMSSASWAAANNNSNNHWLLSERKCKNLGSQLT